MSVTHVFTAVFKSFLILSSNIRQRPSVFTFRTDFGTNVICTFLSPLLISVSVFGLHLLYGSVASAIAFVLWIMFNTYGYYIHHEKWCWHIFMNKKNGDVSDYKPMPSFDIALALPSKTQVWNSFCMRENGWTMSSETQLALYNPSSVLHFPDSVINGGGHWSPFTIK
jgi:hypothetical protein